MNKTNKIDFSEYDWTEAFGYSEFSPDQIKTIIGYDEGENDGDNWVLFVELNNGDYGFLSAGCDYTGWDCRSWGDSYTNSDKDYLIRFNMTSNDRRRLGLELKDLDGQIPKMNYLE